MFVVEVYAAVRQFVFNDGKSRREAARVFGLSRETVSKMCRFSMPPGYVRQRPAAKPKLGPLIPVIEAILEASDTLSPGLSKFPNGWSAYLYLGWRAIPYRDANSIDPRRVRL
jgi:hypothetical protein